MGLSRQKANLPEGTKARRVYLQLRDEIAGGAHAEAATLPGEQQLTKVFEVSRVTIRRALDALEADGLIERKVGHGTVVRLSRQQTPPVRADFTTLMPQLVEMGQTTTARLLSFTYAAPPEPVRNALGLDAGARVQIATRVRSADGLPFSHLTTYVPEDIAANYSERDLAELPLFKLLERSGLQIDGAQQSVSATLAAPDVAEALEVSVGSALLSLRRTVLDKTGRGVEYLSALYRPDLFRLDMDLARVGDGDARHWEPRIGAGPAE